MNLNEMIKRSQKNDHQNLESDVESCIVVDFKKYFFLISGKSIYPNYDYQLLSDIVSSTKKEQIGDFEKTNIYFGGLEIEIDVWQFI